MILTLSIGTLPDKLIQHSEVMVQHSDDSTVPADVLLLAI